MKNKILFAVSTLLGIMMIVFGFNKFGHFIETPPLTESAGYLMAAFAASGWLIPLIAIAEILGGILLIMPKTRALGAIILFPIIIGIFLFHAVMDPAGLPISGILMAIIFWIILENKNKYLPMIS